MAPPSRLTLSTAPPGMFIAAANVGGSPIASTEYGGASAIPSNSNAPGAPATHESTPIRTALSASRTSIASAPAARSSLITSSIVSGATPRAGSSTVTTTPGPTAPTVPIMIARADSRAWAFSMAASSLLPDSCSSLRVCCSSATSVLSAASRWRSESSSTSRSAGRAVSSASPDSFWRTWVTIATPSSRHISIASTPNSGPERPPRRPSTPSRPRRGDPPSSPGVSGSSCRPCGAAWLSVTSGSEQPSPQRGGIAEDADAQHHDDRGGQLGADPQLVAEIDDQRGDQDVEHERHHEHLRVEDALEVGAQTA